MKRPLAAILCLLLVLSVFSACTGDGSPAQPTGEAGEGSTPSGPTPEQAAPPQGQVTLKMLDAQTNGLGETSIPLFESLNPGISVDHEYVPPDNYFAKFSALASANQLPDVTWTQSANFVTQVQNGILMDLSGELQGQNYEGDAVWQETFIPELLDNSLSLLRALGGEYTGRFFGVPYSMTSIAVVYDKNMFEELGLSEPATWAEFEELNDTLLAAGKVPFSLVQPWMDWYPRLFWDQYCREQLDLNPAAFEEGEMTFTDESVKQGLQDFKDMWDRGWLPESGLTATRETMQQIFVQGEIAQFLTTPSLLPYMYENVPESVSLASYAFPAIGNVPPRSLGGSSSLFAVSETSGYKEEGILLLKFLTSKTNFGQDYNMFMLSGLNNVETNPEADQLRAGFNAAAENGFSPEIFVPINSTPELQNAWRSDLFPNYLMGVYELDFVCEELQRIYEESFIEAMSN